MTTISYPGGTIVPDFVELGSGDVEIESRTITHDILDNAPVHTMRATKPQTGTLRLLFDDSVAAHAAKDRLATANVYTITSEFTPLDALRFIVRMITVEQDDKTGQVWFVLVTYEAVA